MARIHPLRGADGLLRLDVERYADGLVLGVDGEVDLQSCGVLRSAFDELDDEQLHRIVVDLSALSFTDSSGLAVLIRAYKHARDRGVLFTVVCPRGPIRDLFAITGLVDVLHLVDTVGQAWALDAERARPDDESR